VNESYKLYGWPGSGSFAIQVALEELGVPYERIWVAREPAAIERFRELNPTGRSPALALPDATIMFESAAILIHLAATHPGAHLAPMPGTVAHARFLQWMIFLSANVYETALRIYYSERYSTRGAADAEPIAAKATADFIAHLELVERHLAPHVLGAAYSIADVYLYMLASWYPGDKAAFQARLPKLARLVQILAPRPSILKTEADHAA